MVYFIRPAADTTDVTDVTDKVEGWYLGQPYYAQSTRRVRTAWDTRGATYGSPDHTEITEWSRGYGQVREKPLLTRRYHRRDDGSVEIDVVDTVYASPGLGDPLVWGNSQELNRKLSDLGPRVETEVLLKLAQQRDGVRAQLGASMAEAKQTLEMLASAVKTPVEALINFKRGNFRGTLEALGLSKKNLHPKFPANSWLAYQYGWKPLFQDVHDIHALAVQKAKEPMFLRAKRSLTVEHQTESMTERRSETARYTVGVDAKYTPTMLSTLDSAGLLNPASIAWELVPFSFVVDWFVPVGNTLQAITATADLTFVRGYASTLRTDDQTLYFYGPDYQELVARGEYSVVRRGFRRIALSHFPVPQLYANPNPFSSSTRIMNALALLTQLFTGRS